ncbi:MAG: hypothetical protein DWQ31_02985 [Planctomycetota bacterium]|nr:MAG: hypothetical protein DWQ31_02985 [Planctomycetota bacterium]REJ88990.1 MAG: hypothetical protein DWQ35_19095 [Planctomycetota bacterium]
MTDAAAHSIEDRFFFFGIYDMSLEIPSDYDPVVRRLIAEGKFRDESEVIAEGLRLVVQQEKLDAEIQAGLDDLETGRRVEAGEAYEAARARVRAIEEQRGQ